MRRRAFIAALGGAAAWPITVHAQQPRIMRRIGFLTSISENDSEGRSWIAALTRGLEELGWTEGRNVLIEYRFGEADAVRLPNLAKELIAWKPDVVVAATPLAATAIREHSLSIPTVFVQVGDPVSAGFVTNLAHPEGNLTGFTNFEFSIGAKWLELIKECSPSIRRVLIVFDPANPTWGAYLRTIEAAAPSLGMQLTPAGMRDPAEIERDIAEFAQKPNGAAIVVPGPVTIKDREVIITAVARHGLPAVYAYRFFAVSGGFISYGVHLADLYKRAAGYVDRILNGAKPADLPVQNPTKFELVINLKTAKALGLEVPPSLLARADEVIE
jgi:putative tryptophan/tyrosine transport system substrate-binding protein